MAVYDQCVGDKFAIYHSDCMEVMQGLPDGSVHLSVYSPPFGGKDGGLYVYSSHDRDLSNCPDYDTFFQQYTFIVKEISRITMSGRMSAVHCMDVPDGNTGRDSYKDFPGDIIKLHQESGFDYMGRHAIWKEPLAVRIRTMQHNLMHKSLTEDSMDCGLASADYLLLFRKRGVNPIPVTHPVGLLEYAGERMPPADVLPYRGWKGKQTENRFSHWIWRQYASAFWDDIRMNRILPYEDSKEADDEKHVHPLQLDVIERVITLRSNRGETVFTPFMGVGSEVYGAVTLGRRGIGAELKGSYFKQAVKNIEYAATGERFDVSNHDLFEGM